MPMFASVLQYLILFWLRY